MRSSVCPGEHTFESQTFNKWLITLYKADIRTLLKVYSFIFICIYNRHSSSVYTPAGFIAVYKPTLISYNHISVLWTTRFMFILMLRSKCCRSEVVVLLTYFLFLAWSDWDWTRGWIINPVEPSMTDHFTCRAFGEVEQQKNT